MKRTSFPMLLVLSLLSAPFGVATAVDVDGLYQHHCAACHH